LGNSFFLPLLFSPIVAIVLGNLIYRLFHSLRRSLGIDKAWCICIGKTQQLIPILQANSTQILSRSTTTEVALNTTENCQQIYRGNFLGIQSQQLVDFCHFLSAGIVSFARGLNDTPKIVALLPIVGGFSIRGGMLAVGLGMAIGGLLNARKVAETMSQKITRMNRGQGLSSNLVTGILVIAASQSGLPVSTTHVSVGSIFGVGLVSRKANPNVFYQILLSWLLTLPLAALFSGLTYWILHR
jgi:PiT family inorganic phosphate transporter